MGNKTRGNGKTKKIIVGVATIVAVAAVAVPTTLALTKEDNNAGALNKNFNIIVSSGIENVPDYNLSISGQAKISELKTLLKGIEGYSITGIYKDESLRHPYLDSEIITENSKIYIGYERITLLVTIFDESGNQLGTPKEVFYKEALTLAEPSKPEDDFATYEFLGWYNERNEQVNLNEITSNLNIHPKFKTIMKEYRFGFTNSNNLDSISVSVGGEKVTLNDTYHYGSTIKLRATAKLGNEITEFKVTVDGRTVDVLTFANRVEEDGKVYYEIELTANGDLNIVYTEALSEYALTIPSGVTVKREGKTLQSGTKIKYGDELEITYTESEGHHKTEFRLEWAEHITGDLWKVTGDLNIIYTEERNEYSLGSIPSGVIVKIGTETLNSNSKIYYGDQLTFTYTETSNRYTGNTKQEAGYNYSEKETTTYVLKVNSSVLSNGSTITVSDNIALELSSSTSLSWEQSSRIEYSLGTIPSGVTVKRGSTTLSNNATIYYGDTLTFTYTTSSTRNTGNTKQEAGYNYSEKETTTYTLKANNSALSSGSSVNVTGNITLSLTSTSSLSWEQGSRITYSLGTIPSGVTVRRNGSTLSSNATIYYGDSLTISYTLPSGMKLTSFKVNNQNFTNGGTLSVTGNVSISFAYEEDSYLTFTECDGGYEVSAFNKNSSVKDIVIPATYNGKSVIGIKDGSFSSGIFSYSNITSVTIEEGVKNIGNNAFYNCRSLTSIKLPNSLITIGYWAFSYCSNLTSISIPSSVTTIGTNTFSYCSSLSSLRVPASVVSFGEQELVSCGNLTSIIVEKGNSRYTSRDLSGNEVNALIDIETKTLIRGTPKTKIPSDGSVTTIGYSAFNEYKNLTSIVIPEQVRYLGQAVFRNCTGLTSVEISISGIGANCFEGCTNLTTVIVKSSFIYKILDSSDGAYGLIANATTIKVLKSIVDNTYYTNTYLNDSSIYSKTSSGDYYIYTKK